MLSKQSGFRRENGAWAPTEAVQFHGGALDADAQSSVFDMGSNRALRLTLDVEAVEGTNPTLDVALLTSHDGKSWRELGDFLQKSGVGTAMAALATEAGTTPPNFTLSGTPDRIIDFRAECTTLGARGVFQIRYSLDGGTTWAQSGIVSAASLDILDENGVDTGLDVAIENAAAAVDNVWTAKSIGRERKVFSGCDRYVKADFNLGGTDDPIVTFSLSGEAI
jgi:hypothetical protein